MCTVALFKHQVKRFSAERKIEFNSLIGSTNVTELAEDVLDEAPRQFALCGLSMGGIVAMEVQRLAPHRVSGLALLDTNPLAEIPEVQQNRLKQIEKVKAGDLLGVMRDEMKPNYLVDSNNKAEILDQCLQMAMDLGDDVFISQSIALRDRPDQVETLRSVSSPTLILCGEQDKLCPPERHQMMHELVSDSTLAIVPNAGHLPVLEQTDETNRYLQDWLQAVDAAQQ